MSSQPTLNSRLRVLVAKTFRAEKLYGSIRNTHGEAAGSSTALSQMANDIRAKEWQRSHYQLRISLNDILARGANTTLAEELAELKARFTAKAEESLIAVEQGAHTLAETAKRHEFAHIFKLSVELIRQKARAQACKVIADELQAVLATSGRQVPAVSATSTTDIADEKVAIQVAGSRAMPSNVIPLRRASGSRQR